MAIFAGCWVSRGWQTKIYPQKLAPNPSMVEKKGTACILVTSTQSCLIFDWLWLAATALGLWLAFGGCGDIVAAAFTRKRNKKKERHTKLVQ